MATCPNGHSSAAVDYCDVCGAPIPAQPGAVAPAPPGAGSPVAADAPSALICPNCHGANPPGALFCEACGYDFTTGSLPRMSAGVPDGVHPPVAPVVNPLDLDAVAPVPSVAEPVASEVPAEPNVVAPEESAQPPASATPVPPPVAAAEPTASETVEAVQPVQPVEPVKPAAPAASAPVVTPAAPAASAPVVTPAAPAASEGEVHSGKAEWVAEVWIDPDWYAGQSSPDQLPSPGLPRVTGLRKRASLVGRPSKSRGIVPDVDCEPDTGVSRRHAELSTDGTRWWVDDLGSSNGTYVGQAGLPLPEEPIKGRTELGEDARVYVGSWTRIVVRRANPDEGDL